MDVFQRQAATILQAASDPWDGTLVREAYIGAEFDGIDEGYDGDECSLPADEWGQMQMMVNFSAEASVDAEYIPLHLPSHFGHELCRENAAKDLAEAEVQLREGQLNDFLHHI